jgi:hypothetical protein
MTRIATQIAITALLFVPSISLAASFQLSPSNVTVTTGQTFTVQVVATPSGSSLYTASAHLSFNPNILEVTNFSFAPTWMQVSQTGYDSTDNTNGALIKTGGFPGGFNTLTNLGTVTFEAKTTGTATISVGSGSILLDQNSTNEVTGAQGSVAVTVTAPVAPAKTQTTTQTTVTTGTTPTTGGTNASTSSNGTTNAGQTASAASALTGTGTAQTASAASAFGSVPQWLWWLLLVLVLLGLGYWGWRQYSSDNK